LVQHIASELTAEPEIIAPPSRDHLHDNQRYIIENLAQFNVLACGRRFGKTTLAMQIIDESIADGEKIWYCAVTHDSVDDIWLELAERYSHARIRAKTRTIYFANGAQLSVKSLQNHKALRGKGLHKAIIDEAAFTSPYAWVEVIQPMLLDTDGGAFIMCSPKGRNWFYDVFNHGQDDTMPEWKSFHYTTYDNPLLNARAIDRLRKTMTERQYNEEILAQFNDSDGAVFRNVRTCATAIEQTSPIEDHNYIFGVDWGRDNDYTVIAVIDTTTSELIHMERFNKIDYTFQQQRLVAMYKRWKPMAIWAESNAMGQRNIDALNKEGLPVRPFATTQKSKAQIIEALALALETEQISIINDAILIHELISYEQVRTASGAFKFSAPDGQHDDCVMALAIAWSKARRTMPDEISVIEF